MKKKFKQFKLLIRKVVIGFFILTIGSTILYRWVPVYVTPLMIIRWVEQVVEGGNLRLKKDWEPMENISPNLPLAVFCSEDQNFLNHHGFDFEAIKKAIIHNENSDRKRGASTISQQTAKNVFLWPGRSWIRKGLEVYFTTLIEVFWSKERIIEVYVNIIETGNGVYGAQASAQYFFKKDALKLSKRESALIAAVLPSPRRYSAKRPSPYIRSRQAWILTQMVYWRVLNFDHHSDNEE